MKKIIQVGQSATMKQKITDENICKFAEISKDSNPIHLDDRFASKSIFKKRIAHGLYVSSFISAVLANKLPGYGTIYLEQKIKFLNPAFINDIIITKVLIEDIINKKIKLKTTCHNQNNDIIIDGDALVIPPKDVIINV